jgi:hypothetical protein|tara:strand:+ start:585 stop:800 length:216 start_codon:yes stop_codon:yes gene_type:complete
MKTVVGLVGYVCMVAIISVPSWLAMRYSDIPIAFLSIMGLLLTFHLSIAFVLSAQKGPGKKYKEIDLFNGP